MVEFHPSGQEYDRLFFEQIVSLVPVNIFTFDLYGVVTWCNTHQANFLGFSTAQEVTGQSVNNLLPALQANAIIKSNEIVVSSKRAHQREEGMVDAAGEERVMLSYKAPQLDSHGSVIGVIGIALDITDLKKTQKSLTESLAVSERAREIHHKFLLNIQHDLRTPVSSMQGMAHEIVVSNKLEDIHECAELIDSSGGQLLNFIDTILKDVEWLQGDGTRDIQINRFDILDAVRGAFHLNAATAKFKGLAY
jgi:PAS domain S-box-containing protein